jgi:hypothetical protein
LLSPFRVVVVVVLLLLLLFEWADLSCTRLLVA